MPKKIDRGDSKKECPSCGLGVSLEARICEFCGWDFEEEDEWILQIEKLERDLLLEKKKFEPGTVGQKIESTLVSPVFDRPANARAPEREPEPAPREREEPRVVSAAEYMIDRERPEPAPRPAEPAVEREPDRPAAPEPVREVQQAPPPKTRKVRSVKAPPQPAAPPPTPPQAPPQVPQRPAEVSAPEPAAQPTRKVRTVRKVKG